ncbi:MULTISPECIES: hypothetical protein [Olivibacter]|uniref:IrrE N-terminal-like domain-containing protein n=1 Tax=Olivibacter oleidegradans TaxID=760123 RepID=A0ABV6HEU6_9SPHI|nr:MULTISPECIES: hypothetical protein [Olivibacter]QEK99885.1 hypothetical protein FKG96_03395 [Olivibacter sp. LS-1]
MSPQETNMQEYERLQYDFLARAEKMFGSKTNYRYLGLFYHNFPPRVVFCGRSLETEECSFKIFLNGKGAINDKKDGIFQLAHEVVHLLSPVELVKGNEINYLEEGMATFFSKLILEEITGDKEFFDFAIEKHEKYLKAYKLYLSLIEVDISAVKKLRESTPVIAKITSEDFKIANLKVDNDLINSLLTKFGD